MAILTISREFGSGGREIGRRVAERLGYQYVDKEQLFQDMDRTGKRWGRAARELDEVCPTFWERHDWQYHGYIALLESLILNYAAADNVVIIGRGAFLLLQDVPFCLKVRLVAPPEVRLERLMVQESLVREKARELMARVDRDRACYLQANYEQAWDDEVRFDCVFNTASLTYDRVVELLVEALAAKARLATPEARVQLEDLALVHRLKALLATDLQILAPTLKVFLEDGTIVVSGVIHTPKELHLVKEITRRVCGGKALRFALQHPG